MESIDYPGLPSHPDHLKAKQRFQGTYGKMVSVRLHGDAESAQPFIELVSRDIPFCPSLGETQTTMSHPVSTSHRSYSVEQLTGLGIHGGSLRFSVGLEPKQHLIENIQRVLSAFPQDVHIHCGTVHAVVC